MLVALLIVDTVLKKSLLRSFQRRGNLPSLEATDENHSNLFREDESIRPSNTGKLDLSVRLKKSSIMNSTAQQIPTTGMSPASESLADNTEDVINDNTAIM